MLTMPPRVFGLAFRDVVKQLFVGDLFAVFHGAKVFDLYAVFPPDVLVCPLLEFHHFWVFAAYGICGPYVCGGNPVEPKAP